MAKRMLVPIAFAVGQRFGVVLLLFGFFPPHPFIIIAKLFT